VEGYRQLMRRLSLDLRPSHFSVGAAGHDADADATAAAPRPPGLQQRQRAVVASDRLTRPVVRIKADGVHQAEQPGRGGRTTLAEQPGPRVLELYKGLSSEVTLPAAPPPRPPIPDPRPRPSPPPATLHPHHQLRRHHHQVTLPAAFDLVVHEILGNVAR